MRHKKWKEKRLNTILCLGIKAVALKALGQGSLKRKTLLVLEEVSFYLVIERN